MRLLLLLLSISWALFGQPVGNAVRIQNRPVAATAPADTEVMCWDAAASTWKPCAATVGTGTVTSSGTPTANQLPIWTSATDLKGVTASKDCTVATDGSFTCKALPAATFASAPTDAVVGRTYWFTDSSAAGTCTGGGSAGTACRCNAATGGTCSGWDAVSGSAYSLPTATDAIKGGVTMSTATSGVAVATDDTRLGVGYIPVTHGATPTFAATSKTGNGFYLLAVSAENVTSSTYTPLAAGEIDIFRICQPASGTAVTFVWPTNVLGGGAIDSTLGSCSNQTFLYNGTNALAITNMYVTGAATAIYMPGSSSGGSTIVPPATGGGTTTLPAGTGTLLYDTTGVAKTGVDINTSNQVTATHLASALPLAQGGTALTAVPGSDTNYIYNNSGVYGAKALTQKHAIGCGVGDPAGSALATGVLCYVVAPVACTISSWDILVDSGTATADIWKVATGTAIPTVSNSIVASAAPAIASGTAIHSTTMTSWTTAVAAFDIFGFNLTTTSGPKYVYVGVNCDETK